MDAVNDVKISLLTEKDIVDFKDTLVKLLTDVLEVNFPEEQDLTYYGQRNYERMVSYCREKSAILIGAFHEGRIVGVLWAYRRTFLGQKRLHIAHVIVNSGFRSSGVGSMLLHTLEVLARRESIEKMELLATVDNKQAISFYETKGFHVSRVQLEKDLRKTISTTRR